MAAEKTVMVIGGTGSVGSYVSYFLARSPEVKKLVIVGRDGKKGVTVLNNALVNSAISHGPNEIEFLSADILTQNHFWKSIQEIRPSVIANATAVLSLFPWFERQRREKRTIPLPLTPLFNLPPLLKLMENVEKSGVDVQVVNPASPDACNPLLTKMGLGPIIGAGTIDLTVQGIRWIVSRDKKVPLDDVSIRMVIHRAHRGKMPQKKIPHYLRIRVRDEEVTREYDTNELISKAVDITGTESLTCPNTTNDALTAASIVRNMLAVLDNTKEIVHVPGVGEMPGGVPARICARGAEMVLPDDLSYEEAFKINQEGLKLEGIERIEKDGAIVFTDELLSHLRGFGIEYAKNMSVLEVVEKTQENVSLVRRLIGS